MFLFIDTAVLLLVLGLARAGWKRGFVTQAIDLVGFTVAVILALRFHPLTSLPFAWLGLSAGWAGLAGGLTIFVPLIVGVAIVGAKMGRVARQPGLHATNRVLGIGFGATWAAVVATFAMLVTQFAPVPVGLSDAVRRSPTARVLLSSNSPPAKLLQRAAEAEAENILLYIRQSLQFITRGGSEENDSPPLRFRAAAAADLRVDREAERELLRLVNVERAERDLEPVTWDERLAEVGRAHSLDMYTRGYFAHRGPDDVTPERRLQDAGIRFLVSGENLALAPSVVLAHEGLMRSPGHRRTILDAAFSKLGVGVYAGPHGLMASQEFCGGC